MRTIRRHFVTHIHVAAVGLFALAQATACIPYTVGSTAETAPVGQSTHTASMYFIPNAVKSPGDSVSVPMRGLDAEWRHGMDERSDVGLRLMPGAGGAIVNYKHRFEDAGSGQPALAYMIGGGVVNWGEHAEMEATLIASGDESASIMPFGGLRAIQVIPITQGAVSDSPTLGGFGGLQFGDRSFSIRPELGVYYDRSALGLRRSSVIFVPAITLARGPRPDNVDAQAAKAANAARPRRSSGGIICTLIGVGDCR
ncbi:MAG TPA: hypothetical protein VGM67_18590 [Gemmatimonadaceae bacterium]|jgi:hypothetical protein